MTEHHTILGGKVHVYKRPNSSLWQCSSYFAGKNRRTSTKEDSLSKAKEIAEDWYLQLRGKLRDGEIKSEKTFREVSEHYLREFDIMTQGQRNQKYVEGQHWRSEGRLVPFFGNLGISEITAGKIQEYRLHRHQEALKEFGKPPGHSTMHQEIVTLRQTLKTALRHGWLDRLPDFSEPYRKSPKISHRAWFSPEEYKQLYEATRTRAQEPKRRGFKWEAEQLHDYVLFAVNTGLRPDEAWRLQFRDVTIVFDDDLKKDDPGDRSSGKAWDWILQEYARCGVAFQATSKPAPPGARLWRERAHRNLRDICSSERRMAHARTYGSDFSQVAARAFQNHPRRGKAPHRP